MDTIGSGRPDGIYNELGKGMNRSRQNDRLLRLIANPPPGSKIAAARKFGIDLTLLARKLSLTPTERLEELASAQEAFKKLRRARKP
jgi:hypothetical protein